MDTEKLKELRTLAQAATPGDWGCFQAGWRYDRTLRGGGPVNGVLSRSTERSICATFTGAAWDRTGPDAAAIDLQAERDAEFIAAMNPTTVIALLDEIERLRARVRRLAMEPWEGPY
jgi:hypothetical protein